MTREQIHNTLRQFSIDVALLARQGDLLEQITELQKTEEYYVDTLSDIQRKLNEYSGRFERHFIYGD